MRDASTSPTCQTQMQVSFNLVLLISLWVSCVQYVQIKLQLLRSAVTAMTA